MAAARKFTEAQIFFLESEFNKGLASTSMTKYGDRFRYLNEKTGLPIDIIQRWINNRSRGPRPTCFRPNNVNEDVDMESEESRRPANSNTETRCFKKPPSTKSATGYAVFCGEVFREHKDGKPTGYLLTFTNGLNVFNLQPFGILIHDMN